MFSYWLSDVIQVSVRTPHLSQVQAETIEKSVKLQPIVRALGPEKAAALPAFHAFSGADNTGCFAGKGKSSCWRAFMEADREIINDLSGLGGASAIPSDDIMASIEKFVSALSPQDRDVFS